jgi:hypothetical protein
VKAYPNTRAPLADPGAAEVDGLFQPSHGSAPDIGGTGQANPTAMLFSAALMLDWLGGAARRRSPRRRRSSPGAGDRGWLSHPRDSPDRAGRRADNDRGRPGGERPPLTEPAPLAFDAPAPSVRARADIS